MAMRLPRLKVPPRMRELLSYDKLSGPVPRLLILESRYWLDGACLNAARGLGWEVRTTPVTMEGLMPREHVERLFLALGEFKPDFVLTVNLSGMDCEGLFARLFEDLRMPYVTWFVDDPRTIIMGSTQFASTYAVALTWEKAYIAHLGELGFPVVRHLPLGADIHVFNAEPGESWEILPTFVGNSMADFAEREQAWIRDNNPQLAVAVTEALDSGRVTRDSFALGLEALVETGLALQLNPDERRHAELLFFVEGTRRLREQVVRMLAPEGLSVRGDEGWRRLVPRSGGPVSYLDELPQFYRKCELNLNTTSIQMPTAVNQRVFDCPAAGGFLLTDAQADLNELFDPQREVACYNSLEECRELFKWYRTHPSARREITLRAHKRVLAAHTYAHRLLTIAAIVKEHFCN